MKEKRKPTKVWYLAFVDTAAYESVMELLRESGQFVGNDCKMEKCPDGHKRPAIICDYDVISLLEASKRKNPDAIKYYIMCKASSGGKLQFWPPKTQQHRKDLGEPKEPDITATGEASEMLKPDSKPPPF